MSRTTINIILLLSLSIIIWLAMYVAWGKIDFYHKNRTPFVAEAKDSEAKLQKDSQTEASDNPANPNSTPGNIVSKRNPDSQAVDRENNHLGIRKSSVNRVTAGLADPENESTLFSDSVLHPPAPGTTRGMYIWLLYEKDHCTATPESVDGSAVDFRYESAAIKSGSLRMVDNLIRTYRDCQPAKFVMAHHPAGKQDSTPSLIQRREDEVVYYLLHMQVAKADVRISNSNSEKL